MLFAHLERILRFARLRPRGPNGARDEFDLAAAAQNLRKVARLVARPTRAPAPAGVSRAAASPGLFQQNPPNCDAWPLKGQKHAGTGTGL